MTKPLAMGAVMAAMMIWMLHDQIMSGGFDLTFGVVLFALAHVAVVGVIAALPLIFPKLRKLAGRHRPSLRHLMAMVFGMISTAGVIHLSMHGAFV